MKKLLLTALIVLIPTSVNAQARAIQAGSAGAASLMAQNQHNATLSEIARRDSEANWKTVKKLSLVKNLPNQPFPEFECLHPRKLEIGQGGRLTKWDFTVLDVVDAKNVILKFTQWDGLCIWVEDYDTVGLVDSEPVRIVDYVLIAGTKSYETIDGGNATIHSVKLLTEPEAAPFRKADALKEKAALEEKATQAAAAERDFRIWTTKKGAQQQAKFDRSIPSKAALITPEGKRILVRLSELIDSDVALIKKLAQQPIP